MRDTNRWHDKEWKKKVEEHTKGKSCAWCDRNEGLTVHHTNESKKRRLREFLRLSEEFLKDAIDRGEFEQVYIGKSRKMTWKLSFYPEFKEKYLPIINKELDSMGFTVPDYIDFSKDTLILCKKCHFAIHNNMTLCSICGQNYHDSNYKMCIDCNKKLFKDNWKICPK